MTDRYPVDIFYVEHLDQVWIVNWRDEEDHGVKTIQVIREASQKKKHHTVHPEPIDGHFDLVYSLFIPPLQVRFRSLFQCSLIKHRWVSPKKDLLTFYPDYVDTLYRTVLSIIQSRSRMRRTKSSNGD